MNEIIACPSCQRQVTVPEQFFGKQVQCPQCKHTFTARNPSEALQPGLPPTVHTAPERPPVEDAWDEPASAPRRRRFEDDDADDIAVRRSQVPHRGSAVLTLGILSLVVCGPILGPIAWIMGNNDLQEMQAGRMDSSGEGITQAGRIIGMVATILSIVVVSFYCLFFMLAMAGGGFR
jgi:hypothetical protein